MKILFGRVYKYNFFQCRYGYFACQIGNFWSRNRKNDEQPKKKSRNGYIPPVEHSWIGLHFIQNKQINSGDCELLSRLAWNLPDFPRFPFVELRVFLQLDFITSIYIGKYLQDLVTIIRSHQSSIDVYLDLRQLRSSAETGFGAQTPFPFPHLLQEEERR